MKSRSFEDLIVWQKAHGLAVATYRFTAVFPRHELFGLTAQMRRSAASVPANIAEGFVRKTTADKLRLYNIAQGSLDETRYYCLLTRDLHYGDPTALLIACDEVGRLLRGYMAGLVRGGDY